MSAATDDRPEYLRVFFPEPAAPGRPAPTQRLAPGEAAPYATKALNAEVEQLARTPEGGRNAALNTAAFNLAQLVAGGYLDHGATWATLHTTALGIGLSESETVATLRSAFGAGERQPRVVAELDTYEAPQATVLHLVEAPGALAPGTDAASATDPLGIAERFPRLDWEALFADDSGDEWILEPLLPARRLVALFSAPKMGKSLIMLEVAVKVSLGVTVLGVKPDRAHRVLYVDFENDPRGDIRQRLQGMGMTHHQLVDLVYLSFPRLAYLDTVVGGLELLAVAQHYGCDVVVIDTISRAVQGEENANDTWLGFYRNTGLRLKQAGIACIRLDHTGKDASKGMRGGSAKYGDVDAVWSMTQVEKDLFQLECTDNRLPIVEKKLTVRRQVGPLRHVVDTTGRRGRIERCVAVLDDMGVPPATPYRDTRALLAEAGHIFGDHISDESQRARRQRASATTLEDE